MPDGGSHTLVLAGQEPGSGGERSFNGYRREYGKAYRAVFTAGATEEGGQRTVICIGNDAREQPNAAELVAARDTNRQTRPQQQAQRDALTCGLAPTHQSVADVMVLYTPGMVAPVEHQ